MIRTTRTNRARRTPRYTDESRARCGAASALRAKRARVLGEKAAEVFADLTPEQLERHGLASVTATGMIRIISCDDGLVLVEAAR